MLDQQSAFRRRFTGFCCLLTLREHAETLSPKNKSLFGIIGKNGLNSGFLQYSQEKAYLGLLAILLYFNNIILVTRC